MSHAEREEIGRKDWGTWPRYNAAVVGFRNYWYPVIWTRQLKRKPVPILLLDERIMFLRDQGQVYALHDRCVHRGVPLSIGSGYFGQQTSSRQEFPGTITCSYHGWTYDLKTGNVVAALTDGPDSPICGKARVKTYPIEERLGLIWVYVGDGDPPPVEDDIPEELFDKNAVILGQVRVRHGNWRYGAENGFDEAHPRYLHRKSLWRLFNYLPGWTRSHVETIENGKCLTYVADKVHGTTMFPGLGQWPVCKWWQRKGGKKAVRISIRLPTLLRVNQSGWTIYSWFMGTDADHHRYLQLAVKFGSPWTRFVFRIRYWTYIRWINQRLFTNQDGVMISNMDAPPERLFRPDLSIVAWRKYCEQARDSGGKSKGPEKQPSEEELRELTKEYTSSI